MSDSPLQTSGCTSSQLSAGRITLSVGSKGVISVPLPQNPLRVPGEDIGAQLWVTALQPAQLSSLRPLYKFSTHHLFLNSDFVILSPQFLISPPKHRSLLPPVQSFAWMVPILPFPFSSSSPAAEWDQHSRQLTLIHTEVSQNPSPAPCAVGTGICSCPALGESTGTAGGIAPT